MSFNGKHLCCSLLFHNIAGLYPKTLFKTRLQHRSFLVNFLKFLKTSILFNTLPIWANASLKYSIFLRKIMKSRVRVLLNIKFLTCNLLDLAQIFSYCER